jgi:hypothetical protein
MKVELESVESLIVALRAFQKHAEIQEAHLYLMVEDNTLILEVPGPAFKTAKWALGEHCSGGYWCGEQDATVPTQLLSGEWEYVDLVRT